MGIGTPVFGMALGMILSRHPAHFNSRALPFRRALWHNAPKSLDPNSMPIQTIALTGAFTPQQEKTYVHLPFDMPPHAIRLDVEYEYSQRIGSDPTLRGGNTLDLGVFDERGIDFLNAGFRGWSGSEKMAFFITPAAATPAYLAGALNPGRWHIMLGLYKIAPAGCEYTVRITIETVPVFSPADKPRSGEGRVGDAAPRRALPQPQWLRGELHCHTLHSDGDMTPRELVQLACARGLDFLAITDHNSISCQRELATLEDPGLVLIRGVEATTFRGHWNIWGIPDWIDFRVQAPADLRAAIERAHALGAVTACNHPKPFGPEWEYADVTDCHCVEVWNGPWTRLNQMALDYWTRILRANRRVVAIGGSDYHRTRQLTEDPPRAPGAPTTWVYVSEPPSADVILRAIRAGHVALSSAPDGARVELRAGEDSAALGGDARARPRNGKLATRLSVLRGAGMILSLLDQNGILQQAPIAQGEQVLEVELAVENSAYVRAELRDAKAGLCALTNPVYLVAVV